MYIGIDFEGSGIFDGFPESPVQLGMLKMNKDIELIIKTYLKRQKPISKWAYKIHKISSDKCANAPELHNLWFLFKDLTHFNNIWVGHNVGTEKKFLNSAFPLANFKKMKWIDTLRLSRFAFPGLSCHSLEDVCEFLNLKPEISKIISGDWHDAAFDACASLVLLRKLKTLPGWSLISDEKLMQI